MKRTRMVLAMVGWIVGLSGELIGADLIERHGKYIHLITDMESAAQSDSLVASFDAAVPQWLKFWNLSDRDVKDWKVRACVIRDKTRFQKAGLIPGNVPDFPFGFTLDDQVWVLVQDSEYYTRHLLLHEGAHAIAFHQFGGAGPTWFMEGTAEMLATHSGVGAEVIVNQIPVSRESVPYWGRFKLMGQLREQKKIPSIETVMRYQPNLLGKVEAYGWSWAATMLLHAYPQYDQAFMTAARNGRDTSSAFNRRLFLLLGKDWPVLAAQWRLMCHELDYGYRWETERVKLSEADPRWIGQPIKLAVQSNRGWQSLGVRIPPGTKIDIQAGGRVTLDTQPKPWISGPAGITFQYNRGRPIGQLLVCILPNAVSKSEFLPPLDIRPAGPQTEIVVDRYSWILFRVNDFSDRYGDNVGQYQVTVSRQ